MSKQFFMFSTHGCVSHDSKIFETQNKASLALIFWEGVILPQLLGGE